MCIRHFSKIWITFEQCVYLHVAYITESFGTLHVNKVKSISTDYEGKITWVSLLGTICKILFLRCLPSVELSGDGQQLRPEWEEWHPLTCFMLNLLRQIFIHSHYERSEIQQFNMTCSSLFLKPQVSSERANSIIKSIR